MPCMYISLTLRYIRYLSLTRTDVFNSKGKFGLAFVSQGFSFYESKLGDIIMSHPLGLGDILFFPGRLSVCLSVCLSVTNRVRSVT